MTEAEFAKLALAIREMYPQSGVLQTKTAMELWYQMLADLPYDAASATLSSWITTSKWPPTVADIREGVAKRTMPELPEWSEAWGSVINAIHRWGMHREAEALESMPEIARETVKRMGWQNICLSEKVEIERATFRDIYAAIAKRKAQDAQLPDHLKITVTERPKLEEKNG